MKLNLYIEQVCIIGDKQKYLTALIVPNLNEITEFAQKHKIDTKSISELCKDERIEGLFKKAIDEVNIHLARYETIKKFKVLPLEFSLESGELTPTLKVKRKVIATKYKKEIAQMYEE